jgi:hypothetical protein
VVRGKAAFGQHEVGRYGRYRIVTVRHRGKPALRYIREGLPA